MTRAEAAQKLKTLAVCDVRELSRAECLELAQMLAPSEVENITITAQPGKRTLVVSVSGELWGDILVMLSEMRPETDIVQHLRGRLTEHNAIAHMKLVAP